MTSVVETNSEIDPKYFKGIGLWQFIVDQKASWWVMLNFTLGTIFLFNVSIQILVTLTGGYEFIVFTEKLSVNLTVMESVVKIIYYCSRRSKLYNLTVCFKRDLLLCSVHDKDSSNNVMSSGFSLVNRVTKSFVVIIFSTVGVWNVLPVLRCLVEGDCSKWNIMPSWYPYTMEQPVFIYFFEFVIMIYCAALLYNVNCFFSALALSLSSQFELLSSSLKFLEKNAARKGGIKSKDMDSLLRDCLIDHQTLLR